MDTKFAPHGVKYKTKSVYGYDACNLDRLFFFLGSVVVTIPCVLLTDEPVEVHTYVLLQKRFSHV